MNEHKKITTPVHYPTTTIVTGCDEAGRGCLAGPVCAAAVILRKDFSHPFLNDSKKLTAKKREVLQTYIENNALAYSVAFVHHEEIDQINILQASFRAMHNALEELSVRPELILVDGHLFNAYSTIPHKCIVKGDSKYASIAAASILAKTYRDKWMHDMHQKYPHYNWIKNKGYPTAEHRAAIKKHGVSPYHRMSYRLLPDQMELFTR